MIIRNESLGEIVIDRRHYEGGCGNTKVIITKIGNNLSCVSQKYNTGRNDTINWMGSPEPSTPEDLAAMIRIVTAEAETAYNRLMREIEYTREKMDRYQKILELAGECDRFSFDALVTELFPSIEDSELEFEEVEYVTQHRKDVDFLEEHKMKALPPRRRSKS